MDSKAMKTALKEARDAIKNKEFSTALKICKNILKSDKDNYMALVFLGISLQEVGPREQAQHAFRKAILSNPDQVLAWNGLASYFEKDESETASKELIPVYEKLLQTESDASKFNDLCTKLVTRALKIQEISKTSEILKSLASNENNNENNRRTAWLAIASLLMQINNLTPELMDLFQITLSTIVKDRSSVTSDFYKEYLKLLYKLKKYELLFDEATKMHALYDSTIYPLEWICKIYVELSIENNSLADQFETRIDSFCDKMLVLQDDAIMAVFAKAVQLFRSKNYIDAREEIKKVVSNRAGLTHAWVLLSECHLKLYCFNDAAQAATRADKLLQSLTKENRNLQNKINKLLLCALARHSNIEKWKQAIELGIKMTESNSNDLDTLISMSIAYIKLNDISNAERLLTKINSPDNESIYKLLKSKIVRKQGNLKEAILRLQEISVESCEVYIEIGTLHLSLKEYELSLVAFLKAAKLDPNYYLCFVYLGQCYEYLKDVDKARRCYQKAFKINPKCMDAGVGLSNIYRLQKNWVANLNLLQSVTGTDSSGLQIINKDVRWAWLQLGLHYLEQGEFTKAIDSLRTVIRVEPNNGYYWECLADAYMARGSYTAAMKSYERATELSDDVLYSKLQFATIKLMLGFYDEAKVAFLNILSENNKYVPALKGLAENCLNQAFDQEKNQLLGRARSNAQYAFDQLTIAIQEKSNLSCLWKLLGDCCTLVGNLPDKYSYMIVEASLAEGRKSDELVPLDKQQLYTLGARCYCKAITLSENNILIWHDLATCYYLHACTLSDENERKKLLHHALATVKYCVHNNSNYWHHWNLLGVISLHNDIKNYSLAQHAFIKAITIDKNCAIAWSNLGTLYLMLNNLMLANKAYSQAQRADPNYVNCWVGQALIAELMEHDDAMDLFRHSTQLSYNSQSALGYASWVCKTIVNAPAHVNIYSIHNMHAIPVALDVLTWYTEHYPYDSCAWNMLGILRERLNLKNSTLEAFKRSLKLVHINNEDKVLMNCARMLTNLKQYDEAIHMYRKVKVASFNDGCGLALALFKAKQYKESYEAYDTTMNWLAKNENMQSHVLVALAAMVYLFKGAEGAKTLLFQSTQLKPPSQWGLYATLALGLLNGDVVMSQLVLKELQPMKDNPEVIYHYAVLQALFYLRKGDNQAAIRSLLSSVHRHPGQASLWHFLSILLLRFEAEKYSKSAANFAQLSIKMGRTQMDVSKILCIISLATCVSKDLKSALKAAQKAVHCHPDVAEGWAVLISVLTYQNYNENWLKQASNYVQNSLVLSDVLNDWFSQLY